MKSFKNNIKYYSREQMVDWCKINIIGFDRDIYESEGFRIYENHQEIFSDSTMFIETSDKELPFKFNSFYGYYVNGINLTHIKVKNFTLNLQNTLTFDGNNSINYNNVQWSDNIQVEFRESDINPQSLHNIKFHSLYFKCGKSNSAVSDFSNYNTSIQTEDFTITTYYKFKNLTCLLDLKIQFIYITGGHNSAYDVLEINKLEEIIDRYTTHLYKKQNRKDHIMDMTLDLLDAGFEDEV